MTSHSSDTSSPRIKICGITNLDDARMCAAAGVNMLGFNFYARSPRRVASHVAREIGDELTKDVMRIGLFVNAEPLHVLDTVRDARLDAVQLHGEESPAYCAALQRDLPENFLIVKALRVNEHFDVKEAQRYAVGALLLDAYAPNLYGGTGRTFDWELASRAREVTPRLFLAGGLTPSNVADAVRAVRPFAVDACSGVEISPDRKCAASVERFVENVRQAFDGRREVTA